MLIDCQKQFFPPLPICLTIFDESTLATNAIISNNKLENKQSGSELRTVTATVQWLGTGQPTLQSEGRSSMLLGEIFTFTAQLPG